MCSARLLWSFESKDASTALAQRNIFIERLRRHQGVSLDLDSAKLIFTELVTNVMRHAGNSIRITLECNSRRVLLRIVDSGPGFEYEPRLPKDPFSEGGRGLFLVSEVAPEVSVERHERVGTSVLAVLPVKLI
jgi:anti-sigma regulatory factor (Ser/Thr protein kinase)